MKNYNTVKINFRGGIISPGDLNNILTAAGDAGIVKVCFGLRQQLLIEIRKEKYATFSFQLDLLNLSYETDMDQYPNIISSYPAAEIFITKTWVTEGVYKDLFDLMDYEPKLKVNISDSNQSLTPLLTGNINWVASALSAHFWHLFIRFPKTNIIYEWNNLIYTNDVARMTRDIESVIYKNLDQFYDNPEASGEKLFKMVNLEKYNTKTQEAPVKLPVFNLPYYEGLNRYNDKYWLGIYRRDEKFEIEFLKDICKICLKTKIGQLCTTSWKSLIIKGIDEQDRYLWNDLLVNHRINVRHAANELNFQIEDNCAEGLKLKNLLVKHLSRDDIRTFGICIGIKTRKKSEVFSSILVKRKTLIRIASFGFIHLYDILCANNFNPNERTGIVFSSNLPKFLLPGKLRKAIISFYKHETEIRKKKESIKKKELFKKKEKELFIYQCRHCLSVYDPVVGSHENYIFPGTAFEELPDSFCCALCEGPKDEFKMLERSKLIF